MRHVVIAALAGVAGAALVVLFIAFSDDVADTPTLTPRASPAVEEAATATPVPPTPRPTPVADPTTWMDLLDTGRGGEPLQLACLDANGDGRLDAADGERFDGVEIALREEACSEPERIDFYEGVPAGDFSCEADDLPLLIVAVGGGGTDLVDLTLGESIGLVVIANGIVERVLERGGGTQVVLASAALFGADRVQTRMEEYLALDIARRLDAMPCLRAVVLGHSHGGATVTSVLAALEGRFGDRIAGVAVDRTTVLYDRPAREMPVRAPLFNVFQLDEGWHGVPIDQPNVVNMDRSGAMAPIAPSDGGGGPAPANHKTLDDAPDVQRDVVDAVLYWYGAR